MDSGIGSHPSRTNVRRFSSLTSERDKILIFPCAIYHLGPLCRDFRGSLSRRGESESAQ